MKNNSMHGSIVMHVDKDVRFNDGKWFSASIGTHNIGHPVELTASSRYSAAMAAFNIVALLRELGNQSELTFLDVETDTLHRFEGIEDA